MPYIVGTFKFEGGSLVEITDLERVEGKRPRSSGDIPKCDPGILRYMEGTTRARVGAGCAVIASDITRFFPVPGNPDRDRVIKGLRSKLPMLFEGGVLQSAPGLLGIWRGMDAPGTCACMDICAGVAETTNLFAEAAKEVVEIGLRPPCMFGRNIGRFAWPDDSAIDAVIENETKKEWARLGEKTISEKVVLREHPIRHVTTTEPDNGSVEQILVWEADFRECVEPGMHWRLQDTEHREDNGEFIHLNRRPVIVVPVEGQAPVMLGFNSEGLDIDAPIIHLEGANLSGPQQTPRSAPSSIGSAGSPRASKRNTGRRRLRRQVGAGRRPSPYPQNL